MSGASGLRSQWNNVREFSRLFPPRTVLSNLVTLPRDYLRADGRAAPPMVLNVLITSRCGLNCAMCSAADFRRQRFHEMTPAELDHILRQARSFRPSVFFSGGEPFLRQDLEDLIAVAKGHGLRVGVVTNALQLTPERGRRVQELGLDHILVSLHGPRDVHDAITGMPGSFERATRHLEAFCRLPRRARVMLNFVMSETNVAHARELVLTGRSLGVDRVRLEHLLFMTREEQHAHDAWRRTHVADEELRAGLEASTFITDRAPVAGLAESLPELLAGIKREFGDFVFIKPGLEADEIPSWYRPGHRGQRRCLFVWRSLFIDPAGDVFPCQHYAGLRVGNALREPLLELWNSARFRWLRRLTRQGLPPACSRCCKV